MCKQHEPDFEIVIAEFNYIAETAFQASEDRAKVTQFFIISFGGFLTALFSIQQPQDANIEMNIIMGIIFSLIYLFGGMTIFQLAKFRIAWLDSICAMNQIKKQSIKKNSNLAAYFRWTEKPQALNFNSIGFSLVILIAVISSVSLGAAIKFLSFACGTMGSTWRPVLLVGGVGGLLLICIYSYLLVTNEL